MQDAVSSLLQIQFMGRYVGNPQNAFMKHDTNAAYAQYDPSLKPSRNIALPDSLLSRFDLVYIMRDDLDQAMDRLISTHVLSMHRHIPAGLEPGALQN
jgi:hypothetical protein